MCFFPRRLRNLPPLSPLASFPIDAGPGVGGPVQSPLVGAAGPPRGGDGGGPGQGPGRPPAGPPGGGPPAGPPLLAPVPDQGRMRNHRAVHNIINIVRATNFSNREIR